MRTLVAVVALCALAGCTGPETPYAEAVQAARLDSTTLRIAGQVNEWTPDARVQDYVLLRAAEETLAAGYSHFRVLERRDSSRLITTTTSESMSSYSPGSKGTKTYTSGSKGTNASAKGRDNNSK